ncbi:MAG: glycerol-3-phosphate dehydrogenase/oxidase [Actinomycetota bacterium]
MIGLRDRSLERMRSSTTDPFDLLVIGGGITGAGIALDAASRGASVALVERRDFASGTSSKSSKLVHGGLRYLEHYEFGLVREAAQERDLLRVLAPQLVEPVPFVLPISDRWMRAKFGVGLWAYDALASFKNLQVHRYLGVEETEAAVPPLPKGKIKGGFLFYDCKNDDVRLVMEVLVQAVRFGAIVANHCSVTNIDASAGGCIVSVEDSVEHTHFEIHAKRVISAAGVWGDAIEKRTNPEAEARTRPSKGIHLSFRRDKLPLRQEAAFIPDVDRQRMLFVIPWLDTVIVGTTDTTYEGDLDSPSVDEDDRRYVLDSVNSVFDLGLTDDDISGAWAGLRPLVQGKAGSTADLSRNHTIYDIAPGVIGITGGKLTTYRRMAKDAVDRIAPDLDLTTKCKTARIRLGTSDIDALRLAVERRATRLGLGSEQAANLIRCYGDRAMRVLDVAESEGLNRPLVPGAQPIAAEAAYCARAEMAVHLTDVLSRRTRLSLTDPAAGIGSRSVAAEVMATAHGWDTSTTTTEVEAHRRAVEGERGRPLGEELAPETSDEGAA